MKFKLNNTSWRIVELSAKDICKKYGNEDEYMYGYCDYVTNKIYLNKELCLDRKKNVLIHELAHCWTMTNGWGFNNNTSREDVCNIVACSNEFINSIIDKYFKEIGEK